MTQKELNRRAHMALTLLDKDVVTKVGFDEYGAFIVHIKSTDSWGNPNEFDYYPNTKGKQNVIDYLLGKKEEL